MVILLVTWAQYHQWLQFQIYVFAKEKGYVLAKQAIIFKALATLDQVFLGRPKAAKLSAMLSLLHGNAHYT